MAYVLVKGFEDDKIVVSGKGNTSAAANRALSDSIFSYYALPFWALSFVLLVAVIGAIVLARKD